MAPGDIVRHPDYPQWGSGYVIRARKTSSDIFFRWGGKRTVSAGESLEPSRVSGAEAELFTWAIDQLPYFALPRYIEFRAEMPRSPVGRVLKRELRDEGVTAATWDVETSGITYEKR